jgi:hypothetical protein
MPVATESLAVPADHRLWLNDDECGPRSRSEPREGDPKGAIQPRETRSRVSKRVDRELVPKRELGDRLVLAAPESCNEASPSRKSLPPTSPADSARIPAVEGSLESDPTLRLPVRVEREQRSRNVSRIGADEY